MLLVVVDFGLRLYLVGNELDELDWFGVHLLVTCLFDNSQLGLLLFCHDYRVRIAL